MTTRSGEEIAEAPQGVRRALGRLFGFERAEAQTYLNELFPAYGQDRRQVARFQDPQAAGGILDCLYPRVAIVEMKRPSEASKLDHHRAQALDYWSHSDDVASVGEGGGRSS